MTVLEEFVEEFLSHEYDPVKAHEYYMKNRNLKGRKAADAEFEKMNVADAQKTLDKDLKKNPKVKPTRRIDEAEKKVIRARALASRIQDPAVKAKVLARVVAAEKKLKAIQTKHGVAPKAPTPSQSKSDKPSDPPAKKTGARAHPESKVAFSGKPVAVKRGKRMEEDETPVKSPSGAKLVDYDGKGLGKATYADGLVYTSSGWSKARQVGQQESPLIRARTKANKIKDPKKKAQALSKIRALENRLKDIHNKPKSAKESS